MRNETSLTQQVADAFQFAFPKAKITLEYPIYVESNLRRYADIGIEIGNRIILVEVKSRAYNFDSSRDREELKQIEIRYLRFLEAIQKRGKRSCRVNW